MANILTIGRIALIIPFIFAFLYDASWNMNAALVIFVLASLTDLLDGRVARARGEVSALGAALDPLADKLLISAALILLVRNGVIAGYGVVAVIVIVLREIMVSGLRETLAGSGGSLPVSTLAKWKTAVQIIAAGLLLASAPNGLIGDSWRPFAMGFLWLAAILTFWTGAVYVGAALTQLRAGKN